jgi:tetratricopeptide (TPR) repeat protein
MPQSSRPAKRRPLPAPDSARPDRHTPFLEVLGRVRARSPRWYRCRAGLLVLELVDLVWLTRRGSTEVGQHRRLAIRRAVARVRPKATRAALDEVLHLVALDAGPQPEALQALIGYGKRLEYESEFRLASHVYLMVIFYATQIGRAALVAEAYEHHGNCMRDRGDSRAAMTSYATGLAVAVRHRNTGARLRIAVAQANVYLGLKDPSSACKVLDPLLRRARTLGDSDLLMRMAHTRANAAHQLRHYTRALFFFAEAMQHCRELNSCGRLLNDIALTLWELGFVGDARKVWIVSSQSTRGDSFARWAAIINLLMVAHRRRDETGFDQHRRALESAPMPARLLVAYWREIGAGSTALGRPAEAQAAYRHAAGFAARYGYSKELAELQELLQGHRPDPEVIPLPPTNLPVAAQELIEKVRALRSLPAMLSSRSSGEANTSSVTPLRTTLKRGRPPRARTG